MVNTKVDEGVNGAIVKGYPVPRSVSQSVSASRFFYQDNQKSLTVNRSRNLLLMNREWLSPSLIDALAEAQQNWINLLEHHWVLEVYSLDLLGIAHESNSLKHCNITVADIVELTAEAPYQPFAVNRQTYYCYTCCLHVAGLGRVRLVIAFDNPERSGCSEVLLTNSLVWSPQTVLSRWLEQYPTLLYHH